MRAGLYVQTDHLTSDTTGNVLTTADQFLQDVIVPTGDVPFGVIDDTKNTQWIQSVYLQDEWHFDSKVTVNYGLRFDHYSAFSSGSQLSPRVNLVWQASEDTTVHAGYSRFFSPPPFELVTNTTISKYEYTSGAPLGPGDDVVKPERSNYYDLGIQQVLSKALTVGFDSYYKQASDLIDEGQFGAPIILTPFNYRYGQVYGFEFTGNYTSGHFQAYYNAALQRAIGKDIVSSQFSFSPDDLAYIADNYIHLDHEQQVTMSGGMAYLWRGTRVSGDLLVGSGLQERSGAAGRAEHPERCAPALLPAGQYGREPCLRCRRDRRPYSAVRCDQRLRHDLSDTQRHRCRRGRIAIRAAARLLRGRLENVLKRDAPRGRIQLAAPCRRVSPARRAVFY